MRTAAQEGADWRSALAGSWIARTGAGADRRYLCPGRVLDDPETLTYCTLLSTRPPEVRVPENAVQPRRILIDED